MYVWLSIESIKRCHWTLRNVYLWSLDRGEKYQKYFQQTWRYEKKNKSNKIDKIYLNKMITLINRELIEKYLFYLIYVLLVCSFDDICFYFALLKGAEIAESNCVHL